MRAGLTYGQTDDYGYYAVEDKVPFHDLHATAATHQPLCNPKQPPPPLVASNLAAYKSFINIWQQEYSLNLSFWLEIHVQMSRSRPCWLASMSEPFAKVGA